MLQFPSPENATKVRRFLGKIGIFRRYVPKFAERAGPLFDLLKPNVEFSWETEGKKSFKDLKRVMAQKPTVKKFDPQRRTELHMDACSKALAGMLLERGDDTNVHMVYAVSQRINDFEKNYHPSKLELKGRPALQH